MPLLIVIGAGSTVAGLLMLRYRAELSEMNLKMKREMYPGITPEESDLAVLVVAGGVIMSGIGSVFVGVVSLFAR